MIDGRFHVASLIALFCALGTGLLIGGALTDNELVRAQQQLWMDNIEADVTALRAEKNALLADLHYAEQLLAFGDTVMSDAATRLLEDSLTNCVIAWERAVEADDDALPLLLQQLGAVVIDMFPSFADEHLAETDVWPQPHVRIAQAANPLVSGGQSVSRVNDSGGERLILTAPGAPEHGRLTFAEGEAVPYTNTAAGQWRLVLTVLDTGCADGA